MWRRLVNDPISCSLLHLRYIRGLNPFMKLLNYCVSGLGILCRPESKFKIKAKSTLNAIIGHLEAHTLRDKNIYNNNLITVYH